MPHRKRNITYSLCGISSSGSALTGVGSIASSKHTSSNSEPVSKWRRLQRHHLLWGRGSITLRPHVPIGQPGTHRVQAKNDRCHCFNFVPHSPPNTRGEDPRATNHTHTRTFTDERMTLRLFFASERHFLGPILGYYPTGLWFIYLWFMTHQARDNSAS